MKKARAVHLKGVTFLGITDSKHWVPMDGPEEFGGSDAGIRPKELLLLALAGCTGSDVASMLNKMRVPYTKFEVDIEAEMSDEHPKVYTKIVVVYRFWGEELDTSKLERAIELSETRYCGVSAMLRSTVDLSSRYEINPEETAFTAEA
ncbi:MAG: OsmC family protein [Candidatus Eisenbacteria bacterium]|uniref:OsmC family protein n=1 Tax=Eiseniibacteriota bacterium TaxID=2212470 RepID=A0A956SHT3_UNCEI|nr:OsmC family protein [Candidatus Eisenbacteria bacterium]